MGGGSSQNNPSKLFYLKGLLLDLIGIEPMTSSMP
jgi:hypothetical protein